jgi:hypothetical protein
MVRTGLIWLRIETYGVPLLTWKLIFGLHKMLENSSSICVASGFPRWAQPCDVSYCEVQ